jgi:hypothetical protein
LRKKDVENNLGMSEYDMNGILRCKINLGVKQFQLSLTVIRYLQDDYMNESK